MNERLQQLLAKWPTETACADRVGAFLARFPSIQELHDFFESTKDLAPAEKSQWAFAVAVAQSVFLDEAENADPTRLSLSWSDDLRRATEGLENAELLHSERADVFKTKLFRVIARGMQDLPYRHEVFEVTSPLDFGRDISFVAVLEPKDGNPLLGNVALYRGNEYPLLEPPFARLAVREVIKKPRVEVDLSEMARIFRFANGKDGYQWGDTRGGDGNYGAETLACLCLLGYVRRTGGYSKNGLGGVWPEVEVTPAGVLALMQSSVLSESQRDLETHGSGYPTATIASGEWGNFDFCVRTGAVLDVTIDEAVSEERLMSLPVRIDVKELATAYPDEAIDNQTYDVLDVGYWTADGRYEAPEEDFREELRHCHAAP